MPCRGKPCTEISLSGWNTRHRNHCFALFIILDAPEPDISAMGTQPDIEQSRITIKSSDIPAQECMAWLSLAKYYDW
tara:strand:- start:1057 stop:1287 length:231 start_codon:yes stop_codon:yes gene_type:complete